MLVKMQRVSVSFLCQCENVFSLAYLTLDNRDKNYGQALRTDFFLGLDGL